MEIFADGNEMGKKGLYIGNLAFAWGNWRESKYLLIAIIDIAVNETEIFIK